MKKWKVVYSCNTWEYFYKLTIQANSVKRVPDINKYGIDENRLIEADNVIIEFEEEVGEIIEVNQNESS